MSGGSILVVRALAVAVALALTQALALALALALTLVATAAAPARAHAATPWMAQFERIVAASDRGAGAIGFLETLDASERQTGDYHWALARAYRAADRPEAAAVALGVYEILKPSPAREVRDLHEWLCHHAEQFLHRAIDHLHRGDHQAAVHDYMHGVVCDHAVMGRQDEGLGETSMHALDRLVHRRSDRPDYWYLLGAYHYHHNHLEAARHAFEKCRDHSTDEYHRWRAKVWLDRTQEDIAAQNKLVADVMREAEASSAPSSSPSPSPAAGTPGDDAGPATPAPDAASTAGAATSEELARNARRIDLDARIRDQEKRIRDLNEMRSGRVGIAYGSLPVAMSYNQRKVKAELAQAEASLAEMIALRDGTP